MKFLIAGLGSIGRRHLQNLVALGYEDIILYRTNQSTLPDDELSRFPVESNLQAALAYKPDAAIIANPTAYHMQVAVPCARAGCAIFLEKPIAFQMDELIDFEKVITQNRNIVFSAYQFRFNPGLKKINELLQHRSAGRPLSFSCHWGEYLPDWHPWEDYRNSYAARKEMGGGVVLTLCHPIDYLSWLFGDIVEINSVIGNLSDLEISVEDFAKSIVQFEDGIIGSLHLDYYRKPKRHDLEITCSDGVIYWEHENSDIKVLRPDGRTEDFPAPSGYGRNDMFLNEMKHFIDVLKGNAEPVCGYREGKHALELAWAILQSGCYKKRVVFHK